MKNSRICEVKNIMEAIPIQIRDIVSQGIPNKHPVPLKITSTTGTFIDSNGEFPRELFLFLKFGIEINQIFWVGIKKRTPCFTHIASGHIGKRQFRRVQSI